MTAQCTFCGYYGHISCHCAPSKEAISYIPFAYRQQVATIQVKPVNLLFEERQPIYQHIGEIDKLIAAEHKSKMERRLLPFISGIAMVPGQGSAPLTALVDTGAEISVMSYCYATQALGLQVPKAMVDCAWSAQENVMPIYGTIALDVEFYTQDGQKTTHTQVVSIVENLSCDVILGNNFVTSNHITVRM